MAESSLQATAAADATWKEHKVEVVARSTDHRITTVKVWGKEGRLPLESWGNADLPAANAQKGADPAAPNAYGVKLSLTVPDDQFPIMIDLYEDKGAGANAENPDFHRHGPLTLNGNQPMKEGKGHLFLKDPPPPPGKYDRNASEWGKVKL